MSSGDPQEGGDICKQIVYDMVALSIASVSTKYHVKEEVVSFLALFSLSELSNTIRSVHFWFCQLPWVGCEVHQGRGMSALLNMLSPVQALRAQKAVFLAEGTMRGKHPRNEEARDCGIRSEGCGERLGRDKMSLVLQSKIQARDHRTLQMQRWDGPTCWDFVLCKQRGHTDLGVGMASPHVLPGLSGQWS